MIFETHAHYDDKAFDKDREELLNSLPAHGIGRVVNVGSSLAGCRKTIELMEQYPYLYGALGVHPCDTEELNEETFAWLGRQCGLEKCVAVGEIGLDYHWDNPERPIQKKWFERQLELARQVRLPVVIHSREAAKDTIDLMTALHAEEMGGVIHCFSYTKECARIFLNMGFFIGVGGVLTYKNAQKLKEALEYIPMDRIVLETDSPYLTPVPNRGKRNSSLNLPFVVQALGELKQLPPKEVERITWENACRLYRLEPAAGQAEEPGNRA